MCWLAWFFVLNNIAPEDGGFLGLFFFYVSLFFSLAGTFSVTGFLLKRRIFRNDDVLFRHVRQTFRQGVMFAFVAVILLLLKAQDKLFFWNGFLILILAGLFEYLATTQRKFRNSGYVR